jgi:hypothetical protein
VARAGSDYFLYDFDGDVSLATGINLARTLDVAEWAYWYESLASRGLEKSLGPPDVSTDPAFREFLGVQQPVPIVIRIPFRYRTEGSFRTEKLLKKPSRPEVVSGSVWLLRPRGLEVSVKKGS